MRGSAACNLLIFLKLATVVKGSSWEWKTYTSMFSVTAMCSGKSLIWCGTSGGLLAFDPVFKTFFMWTNTEGLAYNDVTAITCDEQGRIWMGFGNGLIQKYDPSESRWFIVDDFRNHCIGCLTVSGDSLFVGLDIGMSLYLISRQEVKETYRHLGQAFQVEIPVREILVVGEEIWVATDEGIAHSSISNVNLLDPENWENITPLDGLPDAHVSSLAVMDKTLYAGTQRGVVSNQNGLWTVLDDGFPDTGVLDLIVHQEELHAVTSWGVYGWDGVQWNPFGTNLSSGKTLISFMSTLWVGTERGISTFSDEIGEWETFLPNTPGDNRFADLALDREGNIWCCTSAYLGRGFFRFDGSNWIVYDRNSIQNLPANAHNVLAVIVDADNNRWFGTWGGGLIKVGRDSSFSFYNTETGNIAGIPEDANYAVVSDLTVDSLNTLWLLNFAAVTKQPVIAWGSDDVWTYYGLSEGISTTSLRVITVDMEGRKWIGSDNQGIFVLDDNDTPSNKADDPPIGRLTTNDGLETNQITALAVDRDGFVWIGTPEGLHYYFNGWLERRYGLPSDNITALAVDGMNNLWVGTNVGVSIFSYETYTWTHYTNENSDLVSNDVVSLEMDKTTGTMYIGTGHGLSSLKTPFSEPRPDLSQLSIYPNPFIPKEHGQLTIDNLARDVSVHIFTASGFLVRRFDRSEIFGKSIHWEGTDEKGEFVAGGIYLIVASQEDGDSRVGKVALVR